MKPQNFVPVFTAVFYAIADTPIIRDWAMDLLALGPYAEWADPEDLNAALQAFGYKANTDAAKLVQGVVYAFGPETMRQAAGELEGSKDPLRALAPLYARSEKKIRSAFSSGSVYDVFDRVRRLDQPVAIELLYDNFTSLDIDPDRMDANTTNALNVIEIWRNDPDDVSRTDLDGAVERLLDTSERRRGFPLLLEQLEELVNARFE